MDWASSSKADLKRFPDPVQNHMGFAIYRAQLGHRHRDAKPLKGFGSDVVEVIAHHDGHTFRAVYVLHTFQKKAKRGIATPKRELDLAHRRLRVAERHHCETHRGASDAMEPKDTAVERGSGNVFADPGFPDADAHLVKAELVGRIDDIVRARGITQTEATRLLSLSQPDVSRLLRGDFREYSLERLFRLLTMLGRDIDIVVRQPRSATGGKLRIAAAEPA